MSRLLMLATAVLGTGWCGCTTVVHNAPLERYDPQSGYRFDTLALGENNTDQVLVVMTFSGGGTRAAAFAYGVLQGLRDTAIPGLEAGAAPRRLLDEVDAISSVSGGSFTAMGYGLWGDALFDGAFEEKFLYHNVQRDLILSILNPLNALLLATGLIDESDLSWDYYNRRIFGEATYADLLQRGRRPLIVVNATDTTRKQSFQFTQENFDLLGSDLSTLPVSWAVAASSAFPILLSPMRLKYYHGEPLTAAVRDVVGTNELPLIPRRHNWAKSLLEPTAAREGRVEVDVPSHQYMYLLDGGLSDNLGLFPVLQAYRNQLGRRFRDEKTHIERFVVVIIDAGTNPPDRSEAKSIVPSQLTVLMKTTTTAMDNLSDALVGITKYALLEAQPMARKVYNELTEAVRQQYPDAKLPPLAPEHRMENYVIHVSFEQIADPDQRIAFLEMKTSFALPRAQVDALVETGRRLVMEHPELRRLVRDLGGSSDASP